MIITIIIGLCASLITIMLVAMFFRPTVVLSVGILATMLLSITLQNVLGFAGGVTAAWLAIASLGVILVWIKYRTGPWKGGIPDWAMLAFAAMVLISYKYTPSPMYGWEKAILFLASCLPLYYLGRMIAQNPIALHRMLNGGAYVSIACIVVYLLMVLYGKGFGERGRLGGGMSIMYGVWLNSCLAFQVYWLYRGRGWQRILAVIAIILVIGIVPFTGSRGAVLFLMFGAGVTFLSFRRFIKSAPAFAFIIIVLVVVLVFFAPAALMQRLSVGNFARVNLYRTAAKTFTSHPIAGVGVGGYSRYYFWSWMGYGDHRAYPHNLWLEVACEQGLLGLIPLIILTYFALKGVLWLRKYQDLAVSRSLQMLFWISFTQGCFTADLPMYRGFFAMTGILVGLRASSHLYVTQAYQDEDLEGYFDDEELALSPQRA